MISNGKPVAKIDDLIQSGLGDINRIAYYRVVMMDPHAGFYNTVYREYATDVYNKLLDYVLNDNQLYTRLRQLLLAEHHQISPRAFESLMTKSVENNIPLETLIEVYNRGYRNNNTKHLTNEQFAFNRVNSFINKGRAFNEDNDLAIKTIKKVARGKHG